jgi:hypothetical protein
MRYLCTQRYSDGPRITKRRTAGPYSAAHIGCVDTSQIRKKSHSWQVAPEFLALGSGNLKDTRVFAQRRKV